MGGDPTTDGERTSERLRQSASLRVGSLCTGIRGLDLAVEQHFGAETIWYSEIEKALVPWLAEQMPGVPNLGDLKLIDWAEVGPVDILTAGYPCPPFSYAGKTPEQWDAWTAEMQAKHGNGNGHGKSLSIEAQRLATLPTPKASDADRGGDPERWKGTKSLNGRRSNLVDAAMHFPAPVDWGIYEPAIRRHEPMLGRAAPLPKLDNKLSPHFVEWMQCYPEGWLADLLRTHALKALGNAVVPVQALAALAELAPEATRVGAAA